MRFGRVALVVAPPLIAAMVAPQPPGGFATHALFQCACIFLALTAFLPPVSYGFSALAIFLLLGFWLKVTVFAFGFDLLIEPIGSFAGSVEAWNHALLICTVALSAVGLTKILWYALSGGDPTPHRVLEIPGGYLAWRRAVWVATFALILAGNLANWRWRFYVVGLDHRLVLPFHLNVVVALWLTIGSGMWIAVLVDWERRLRSGNRLAGYLLVPVGEALLTTVVMLSRGFYLMKVLPYALTLANAEVRRTLGIARASLVVFAVTAIFAFCVAVVGVSWFRTAIYPKMVVTLNARPDGPLQRAAEVKAELARMIVGRWIGLEGVLAVSSSQVRSVDLLKTALAEDAGKGNGALYQQISRSPYRSLDGYTFLTVPGVVGVFAYAGSHWILVVGIVFATLSLLGTEAAYRFLFDNDFLGAVVGVGMANALAQMNFPYLTGVLFIELWATLVLLWLLIAVTDRIGRRRSVIGTGALP
jgi:hypothetical protein